MQGFSTLRVDVKRMFSNGKPRVPVAFSCLSSISLSQNSSTRSSCMRTICIVMHAVVEFEYCFAALEVVWCWQAGLFELGKQTVDPASLGYSIVDILVMFNDNDNDSH